MLRVNKGKLGQDCVLLQARDHEEERKKEEIQQWRTADPRTRGTGRSTRTLRYRHVWVCTNVST